MYVFSMPEKYMSFKMQPKRFPWEYYSMWILSDKFKKTNTPPPTISLTENYTFPKELVLQVPKREYWQSYNVSK